MRRTRGYTLLEMVVVLALLGLATAMVAPMGYRMVASWTEDGQAKDVFRHIAGLPLVARNEGRQLHLQQPPDAGFAVFREGSGDTRRAPPDDTGLIALPEGWSLRFDTPLVVRPNGMCSDARGVLDTGRVRRVFDVQAPFCSVRERVDGDGNGDG